MPVFLTHVSHPHVPPPLYLQAMKYALGIVSALQPYARAQPFADDYLGFISGGGCLFSLFDASFGAWLTFLIPWA